MIMYRALWSRDEIGRPYVARKEGGRRLASTKGRVDKDSRYTLKKEKKDELQQLVPTITVFIKFPIILNS